jgi:hypothetical protein
MSLGNRYRARVKRPVKRRSASMKRRVKRAMKRRVKRSCRASGPFRSKVGRRAAQEREGALPVVDQRREATSRVGNRW